MRLAERRHIRRVHIRSPRKINIDHRETGRTTPRFGDGRTGIRAIRPLWIDLVEIRNFACSPFTARRALSNTRSIPVSIGIHIRVITVAQQNHKSDDKHHYGSKRHETDRRAMRRFSRTSRSEYPMACESVDPRKLVHNALSLMTRMIERHTTRITGRRGAAI